MSIFILNFNIFLDILKFRYLETKQIIFLADDHELVAKGVSSLLLQLEYVGSVTTFKNVKELFNLSSLIPALTLMKPLR